MNLANSFHQTPSNTIVSVSLIILIRLSLIAIVLLPAPGGGVTQVWLAPGAVGCSNPDKQAYTLEEYSYIIICPPPLSGGLGPAVGDPNRDFTAPEISGTTIDDAALVLSMTIFHELLHLLYRPLSKFCFKSCL
jgi:hypothetical protein